MKIPSDNIGSSLLKPLDAELAAALDPTRLALDGLHGGVASEAGLEVSGVDARGASRDPGEALLATDVWQGSAPRLDLGAPTFVQTGSSADLDHAVDTILAGLR